MRLFSAAVVGILISFFAIAPAAAAVTITIKMEPKYLIDAAVRPTVSIAGSSGSMTLTFRRHNNGNCEGSATLSSSRSAGNGDHVAPELQTGNPGPYSLRITYGSTTAPCQPFLLQRKVAAAIQLAKNTYEVGEKIEPAVELTGTAGDAAGQMEIGRWPLPGCATGKAASAGIVPVVAGQPQGTVNLQHNALGTHSFNAVYSGDERHAEVASPCRDYTVGAYIRGKIYQDADGNGVFDTTETGLAAVTVTLRRPQGGTATATTKSDGGYEFFVTASGQYTVTPAMPTGFDLTTDAELAVQMTSASLADKNFGVVELPSTLLPMPTSSASVDFATLNADTPTPDASESLAWLRIAALALVVLAVLVLLYLLLSSRSRPPADPF